MSVQEGSKEILSEAQEQNARHKLLMLSRPYGLDTERRDSRHRDRTCWL